MRSDFVEEKLALTKINHENMVRTGHHTIVQALYHRGLIFKQAMTAHADKNKMHHYIDGRENPTIDLKQNREA